MSVSEYNLKDISENKNFINLRNKKMIIKICDMSPDLLSYCQEKIQNTFEKYLNVEGEPNLDLAAKILKDDMEKDNGPTWICMIGQDFSFNIKSQKEACLYCYLGNYGILLYKC